MLIRRAGRWGDYENPELTSGICLSLSTWELFSIKLRVVHALTMTTVLKIYFWNKKQCFTNDPRTQDIFWYIFFSYVFIVKNDIIYIEIWQ